MSSNAQEEICKICRPNKKFPTLNDFGEHLYKQHAMDCWHCYTVCPNKALRDEHMLKAHFQHPCNVCLYTFNTEKELAKHYAVVLTKSRTCCKVCRDEFVSDDVLWFHCQNEHIYHCPMDDYGHFQDKKAFDEHLKLRHHLFPCEECHHVKRSTKELEEHAGTCHRKEQKAQRCLIL